MSTKPTIGPKNTNETIHEREKSMFYCKLGGKEKENHNSEITESKNPCSVSIVSKLKNRGIQNYSTEFSEATCNQPFWFNKHIKITLWVTRYISIIIPSAWGKEKRLLHKQIWLCQMISTSYASQSLPKIKPDSNQNTSIQSFRKLGPNYPDQTKESTGEEQTNKQTKHKSSSEENPNQERVNWKLLEACPKLTRLKPKKELERNSNKKTPQKNNCEESPNHTHVEKLKAMGSLYRRLPSTCRLKTYSITV